MDTAKAVKTIALTGGSGRIGRAIAAAALQAGHRVVSIDRVAPAEAQENIRFVQADIGDYDALVEAFRGCDALIHMAAIPSPVNQLDHVVHNNNVVGSYNAMRAAIEVGITRICQASSVNAIGLSFSREGHFDYFPIDEKHANYVEEPYALSKWICEQQADAFVRRYDNLSIASLRFHWVSPDATVPAAMLNLPTADSAKHLWGYTRSEAAARACLAAIEGKFIGHEAFYIVSPVSTNDVPSLELAARWHPTVPVTGDLSGNKAFFDSSKAERILGWRHDL